MKKLILVLGIFMLVDVSIIKGQDMKEMPGIEEAPKSDRANHVAFGYQVNNFAHDFGYGIGLTSPYFAMKALAIRASCNFQWFNYIDQNTGKYTMAPYENIKVGLVSSSFILDKGARLYGEIGTAILICPNDITSTNISGGGYGLFGFEFFISRGFSYFIELGGVGTKTMADNVPTVPYFSTGFTTSGGLRIYFKGKK